MQVKPIGNRILVKAVVGESVTKSGLILPDTAEKQKTGMYEVVAVGNGENIVKFGLVVGTKLFAGKYSGDDVEMADDKETDYKILYVGHEKDESDVVAIVE